MFSSIAAEESKRQSLFEVPKSLSNIEDKSKTASFPFLVLAVSLLLTIGVTYNFHQNAKNKDKIRFAGEASQLQTVVENKINLYIALLKGGRGFIESNRQISRENFAEYVKSLELEKNYTGVEGIGYIQIVPSGERVAFVQKMKAENSADFEIYPAAEKKDYRIVTYLEPFNGRSRKIIGFDVSTEKDWSDAADRAAASGEAAATGKITLPPEDGAAAQTGFLIYLSVYKNADSTVETKTGDVSGYIYSPFRADNFLKEVQNNQSAADVSIKIYDGTADEANLLMQTAEQKTDSGIKAGEETYSAQKELSAAGRNWLVQFRSSPAFAAQSSVSWTLIILVTGVVLSLLLFGMTYWETFARIKLQATAAELSELERQKQGLLEKEQKARLSAERANKTKDEFIAVVSHELRTPLNTIAGWTRILKSDDLSVKTKNLALEKIEKNLRSQTKLVEEMLDYSQIVAGTIKFETEEFSFSKAFENIYSEIEPAAREKSIELFKDNRLNGQFILGDENKIKIVIHNLLNNAVKFTGAGGRIETVVAANGGEIRMTVKDNGKGISSEFLPYIFDRFTQADSSITRGSGGLGLGLTVSHHIIKLHHGTIEAASEGAGKGAIFTIKVPHFDKSD